MDVSGARLLMAWRQAKRYLAKPGPRHSADWYDQSEETTVLAEGDRMFIRCVGGPSISMLEAFPPRLEIAESGGSYVLIDAGPRAEWRYEFVPTEG